MGRKLRGLLYFLLWYGSIMSGFLFIACPFLPLLLISPPTFRKCLELLFSCWEMYPAVLLELFGVKVVVSGDHIRPDDSSVMVMNHRTRVDWNFFWGAMYQAFMPHAAAQKLKLILKDPIRHIPGPGWIMQMNNFVFITRHWEEDQGRFSRALDYLMALRCRNQFLIFPEGTDLTASSKQRSDRYAKNNNLPEYLYTLHPKTTGFAYLVKYLQQADYLDAVYDLTIGYPDLVPQFELDLFSGKIPDEVHFHIQRIAHTDMPKDEVALKNWLEERWRQKERALEHFYKNKSFPDEAWPQSSRTPLRIAFVFWTLLSGAMLLMLVISPIFQLWVLCNVLLFVAISLFSTGLNQLEISWYWKWRSLIPASNKLG